MEKQLKPQLRFPEFHKDWKYLSLASVYPKIVVGFVGSVSNHYCEENYGVQFIRTLNVKDGWFSSENFQFVTKSFHNKNKKSQVKNGDILIARVGANMGMVCEIRGLIGEANSANVIIIKDEVNNSSSFYSLYLSSIGGQRQIQSKGAGGAQEVLNISVAKTIIVPVPSLQEQQKIASFLSDVDAKITQLTKKKDLLEQYKKGIMQKIFSQELRFKDDNGNEFPKWQKRKLGEVLDYEQPTKYIVESTEYDDSFKIPVLTAGKSFLLGYTNETEGVYNQLPTIIFDDFTMANKYVDFEFKVKSSAMKILQPKNESVNIKFVYEAIQMINYPKGDEHKRFWISEYSKIKIGYPCREEQTKIANFLSDIDAKIEALNIKIENSKTFKKGLLQQMFV